MNIRFEPNTLYYGDWLDSMRNFPNESINLIAQRMSRACEKFGEPHQCVYVCLTECSETRT